MQQLHSCSNNRAFSSYTHAVAITHAAAVITHAAVNMHTAVITHAAAFTHAAANTQYGSKYILVLSNIAIQ